MEGLLETESDEECKWMLTAFLEAFRDAPDIVFRSARQFRGRARTYCNGSGERAKNCCWTRRVLLLGFAYTETTCKLQAAIGLRTYDGTENRTGHPGYPAVQVRLACDQIRTGSESLHVKYGAK